MADGWLFRLRSTLGARHAVPAWPASSPPDDAGFALSAPPGGWPSLRETAAAGLDLDASTDGALAPPLRTP